MHVDRRAVLGLGLGGLGFGLWTVNMVSAGFSPFVVFTVLRCLGLLAAAVMLATLGLDGARRGLPVAFAAGTFGSLGDVLSSVRGDISFVNDVGPLLGWLLLTWYAVLHALEPASSTARLFGLRVGLGVVGVTGFGFWLTYSLGAAEWQWIPGNIVGFAGLLLAARFLAPAHGPAPAQPTASPGKA